MPTQRITMVYAFDELTLQAQERAIYEYIENEVENRCFEDLPEKWQKIMHDCDERFIPHFIEAAIYDKCKKDIIAILMEEDNAYDFLHNGELFED